jgi:hypothetical protein
MKKFFRNVKARAIIAFIALAFLASFTGACSVATTGPDQAGLHYDGGPLTTVKYKNCIDQSSREIDSFADKHYKYPTSQRSWDFTGGDKSESGPISVTDKDGVTLQVPGTLLFTLNTNCDILRDFHERVGNRYKAYEDEGWLSMLRLYIGQPLEKAMDQASQKYTWRQILQDTAIRDQWEDEVGTLTRRFAADQAGGDKDYFCAPSYTGTGDCGIFTLQLQKPILPEQVANALAETAAEVERQAQAEATQNRIDVEAVTLASLSEVLGPEMAVLYMAMKEGDVQVFPVPFGSALNVTPQAPAAE